MDEGRLFSFMVPVMEEASMGAMAWQQQCGHSSRLGMFEALGNKRCKQLHKLANKQTTTIAILHGSFRLVLLVGSANVLIMANGWQGLCTISFLYSGHSHNWQGLCLRLD